MFFVVNLREMRLATVPLDDALGGILIHNIADEQGHKALPKGKKLDAGDLEKLRALGRGTVYVGLLDANDVREDDAVARIAHALSGANLDTTKPVGGRVNLFAQVNGILKINDAILKRLNAIDGVTIATIPAHAVVAPKKMVATIKTIGLALPEKALAQVEEIARGAEVLALRELRASRVAIVLTGDHQSQKRVEETFIPAIRSRVEELGGQIVATNYIPEGETEIARAIEHAALSSDCIILAGETSIMDADDITPRGIKRAGGNIELYGAPVEPGNLLLLAYRDSIPIIGAPGCVKSRETNVVDLILPRLLAGERVTKADVIELANGGLLI